jgi:hypothetical protein
VLFFSENGIVGLQTIFLEECGIALSLNIYRQELSVTIEINKSSKVTRVTVLHSHFQGDNMLQLVGRHTKQRVLQAEKSVFFCGRHLRCLWR